MGDKQAQEQAETTAPVMPTEEQTAEETASQIPDGENDRTAEQFEKLKAHNKQLKEELERAKATPTQSVLESLRPSDNFPSVSEAQAQEIAEKVFDEQGYVDPNLLNQRLAEAQKTAREAIEAAQQAQQQLRNFEETQQTQQLYQKYPQLDPNGGKFDQQFYQRVRNELIGQLMSGKKENAVAAADAVSEVFNSNQANKAREEEESSLKQQASSNLGASQGASSPVDHDWLVDETRKGNSDALAERLNRAGF